MIGQTISHYRITEKLGEGGMGVVYKAEDTKLKRFVALKFLRSDVLEDEEHKERFLREAQAAAALDHSNICTVYEIDKADGQTFLSMAYLEGETVKEKIKARPVKLDEAIDIAVQTAQGLQAAHEKGIVHRDIKSANLMATPQGQVKIMDFGLAQLAEQSRLTKTATILGTPAYMAPEQAQKSATDRRTDIWSLGVVIYEMVTGTLPFERERLEAVLYAIGNEEPEPVTALRAGLPMELEWIVGKALAKDADERYQHVDEMCVDLRSLRKKLDSGQATVLRPQPAAGQARTGTRQPVVPPAPSEQMGLRRKLHLPWALFAVSAIALLAVSFLHFREAPSATPEAPLRKFALTPPVPLGGDWDTFAAISPNGKHIAFPEAGEQRRLWVQDLDSQQLRAIEGTEGAAGPFWSPGSDFIGFGEIGTGGELRKVSVEGGPVITLCQIPGGDFYGGAWSPDGDLIVFGGGAAQLLYEVPAGGGTPKPLVSPGQIEPSTGRPIQFFKDPPFLALRSRGPCPGVFIRASQRGYDDAPRHRDRSARSPRAWHVPVLLAQQPSGVPVI